MQSYDSGIPLPENEPLGSNSSNPSNSLLLCSAVGWAEAGGEAGAGAGTAAVVADVGLAPTGEDALGAYASADSPSLLII